MNMKLSITVWIFRETIVRKAKFGKFVTYYHECNDNENYDKKVGKTALFLEIFFYHYGLWRVSLKAHSPPLKFLTHPSAAKFFHVSVHSKVTPYFNAQYFLMYTLSIPRSVKKTEKKSVNPFVPGFLILGRFI